MLFLFSSFLLLLTSLSHYVSPANNNHLLPNTMDPSELQTLYSIMETLSSDQKWRTTYPNPCNSSSSWVGIECKPGTTDTHLHVTRLDFGTPPNPACKHTATFPSHIFQLPYLQSVFFFHCFTRTHTTLSVSQQKVGLVSSLQQLSLRSNQALVGSIPSQLFTQATGLEILTLSQSRISGSIPVEVSWLGSLVHLDLSYNQLTGSIPVEVCRLKNLVGLDLSYNELTGSVPGAIGELGALQKLDLSSNLLTGIVPSSIDKMGSLVFMALSNNELHGKLPSPEGLGLEYLIMENNPMFVRLPAELGRFTRLRELRLANSGYSGEIPAVFSRLTNLTTLSLQNNRLTGGIPAGFGALSHLYHMNLSRNLLSGVVPFDAGFLRRLGKNLDLSGNTQLCLDGSEEDEAVMVGVEVCGRNTSVGSKVKPLKTSEGAYGAMLPTLLFFLTLGLDVLEFHDINFFAYMN